jgi:hypothetical protein
MTIKAEYAEVFSFSDRFSIKLRGFFKVEEIHSGGVIQNIFETKSQEKYSPLPMKINHS